jgi:hypothetical protein
LQKESNSSTNNLPIPFRCWLVSTAICMSCVFVFQDLADLIRHIQ